MEGRKESGRQARAKKTTSGKGGKTVKDGWENSGGSMEGEKREMSRSGETAFKKTMGNVFG